MLGAAGVRADGVPAQLVPPALRVADPQSTFALLLYFVEERRQWQRCCLLGGDHVGRAREAAHSVRTA